MGSRVGDGVGDGQWAGEEQVFPDGLSADEMFLDDPFEGFGSAMVIPGAFGIDDCDRAGGADLETVGLGAGNQSVGTDQSKFLEPAFKVIPGELAGLWIAAFRIRWDGAQEDVAFNGGQAELAGGTFRGVFRWIGRRHGPQGRNGMEKWKGAHGCVWFGMAVAGGRKAILFHVDDDGEAA
jgi:hypothetical protein